MEAEALVESDGGVVFCGDFECGEVHVAAVEAIDGLFDEAASDALTAVFGDDADILDGADRARSEDSLDAADIGGWPVGFGLIDDEPCGFGAECLLCGDVAHQVVAAFCLAKAVEDAAVEVITERPPFDLRVSVEQEGSPGHPVVACGQLYEGLSAVTDVQLHAKAFPGAGGHVGG